MGSRAPELPGLIRASVCSIPGINRPSSLGRPRLIPLLIPTATEFFNPKGLPMTMANCPGRTRDESPIETGSISLTSAASTLSMAISLAGLRPSTTASASAPSKKDIRTRSALLTT